MRKVVITGLGLVSPLGCDESLFWQRIVSGQSGIRRIQQFDVTSYPCQIAGEVVEFNLDAFMPKKDQRRSDPYSHYAIGAAKMAIACSGLDMSHEDPCRAGVIVGSGIGGLQTLQTQHTILKEKGPSRCSPYMILQMISNMAAGLIAIEYQFKGPNFSVVSACATAAHAIGEALRTIQHGDADIMVAGGSDASVCELGFAGFCALKALSTRNDEPQKASRPFDLNRDGFVMSEGAGILVLEELEHARQRGAPVYCELSGYGATCDAFHETAPSADGEGAARSMQLAMAESQTNPAGVDYINAHGTSTSLNDKCETLSIKKAFGAEQAHKVMISSTKSMTGHLLGAAGGVEAAICALAIKHGVVPATINYETPDPDCDLDYVPNTAREKKISVALSNSLGFGGHNATLAFRAI
ncbi:MAG: beta-ketoacyl-ACP synthase II [Verrucomicrobia bacterium]|nr:beta-ketoacyl-ACP synthase II [Verrucomicrobiota bacterium]MCG2681203.1 beta-ketoacyl-ACP synthase II [Kiritimatiellia bacterium]MBU4246785.1 beta-ketoacyl-ACP synthase II [Verrucomicrobiota bacterium]MBU4290581.1 beta-ketoacyl-ACP synthase II [Verrucomicrobiota bacterium]MBU4429722.1 beta-ketoacyl-ACP synthase II [Verrucomicrobiota bacterium]